MQKNASLLAIVAVDTAENEPSEVCGAATLEGNDLDGDQAGHAAVVQRLTRGSGVVLGAERSSSSISHFLSYPLSR